MHVNAANVLYSATDLVNFLGCAHATTLDVRQLVAPVERKQDDPYLDLLQAKGVEHEEAYLASLRSDGRAIVEIDKNLELDEKVARTRVAMRNGADVIYQGALFAPPWHGYSDFLLRVDGVESKLGKYGYEVVDTKLSRSAKPKHVVQLCVYSTMVALEQELLPRDMHLVLGDRSQVTLKVNDFLQYCEIARRRFSGFVTPPPTTTTAEPCGHCHFCHWAELCEKGWDDTDHLSLVANISREQIAKLSAEGITTIRDLASMADGRRIPRIQPKTMERLREQARLQAEKRAGGPDTVDVLPPLEGKGFARLPKPDAGDLFFDMEGDPLYEDGLEYLFGFDHVDDGAVRFTPFWAHDRAEEKKAFQAAVDFMVSRLERHPGAHIYHYASYEESALKRLAMLHGTREVEVDDLLRGRKLVDLYKVVREGIRVSEPSYSLKHIEVFYTPAREGEVKSAGDSIVVYETWRETGDPALLKQIAGYNEIDCRSTRMCRDWLLGLRPGEVVWFTPPPPDADAEEKSEKRRAAEAETAALQERLLAGVSNEDKPWRELLCLLLDFHKREAKPDWWWMFDRMESDVEKLIDDTSCIAGLTADPDRPPSKLQRSMVYSFTYPAQELKMRVGDKPLRSGSGEAAGEIISLDEDDRRISLKLGPSRTLLPDGCSLIPDGPLDDKTLRAAIVRYAEAVAAGDENRYGAITSILRRRHPERSEGSASDNGVGRICSLTNGHILVQGPPGAGKTYTSSHAIVELLARGKRVGVSSNSHKAINNLLKAVEDVAIERGITFRGIKKSSNADQYLGGKGLIEDTTDTQAVADLQYQLVAGTAWVFVRQDLDQSLDFLFIDEAGQVSLANVVAIGVSTRNLVLVGDQMQLAQPLQGAHPGDSGKSALDYLLQGHATVPHDRGIFLGETWRLHPAICRFVSDAVYDGRLAAAKGNDRQTLVLHPDHDAEALAPYGLRFVDVMHEGCSQDSEEEAARIRRAYDSLLEQSWTDRDGATRQIRVDDILVVTPYNMQVALLKAVLPPGARVGTVDKLQGQQAAVAFVSMATSSGEDLPRNMEFLFSRNRLNVAISRAQCLSVVFASPRLLEVPCRTIDQMRLVNTLCWVKTYGDTQRFRVRDAMV
jgi:predicted RecB family nuclease